MLIVDHDATVPVLRDIAAERLNQQDRWGTQSHPDGTSDSEWRLIADESRALCDEEHRAGRGTWTHIACEEFFEALAEADPARLRAELVQAAAVITAWVEAIDRRGVSVGTNDGGVAS